MNLVAKWGRRNKRDTGCYKKENSVSRTMGTLGIIVGGERAGKKNKNKRCENVKCVQRRDRNIPLEIGRGNIKEVWVHLQIT